MCLICERIKEIAENKNPYFVKEMTIGYVVIGDHQYFEGYTLFLCKRHVNELHELPHEYKLKFLDEMSLISQAVSQAFQADKMNIELLGNGESHVHWHLFPRKNADLGKYGHNGKGPVWWLPFEKMYAENVRPNNEKLQELKIKLLDEINKIS